MTERLDALVIGAGFAGLGVGAALRAAGQERFAILEQGRCVGHFWSTTYDRLHLHSAFHDMPHDGGMRREYPIFLARNALLDYLRRYAELHRLGAHLRFGSRVARVQRVTAAPDGYEWEIETAAGRLLARHVAVATAVNRVPKIPELPGRDAFPGTVRHSAEYRNAVPFVGRSVLVVGSGNSAAEISLDLVEHGAREVAMWVRGPRHFIPIGRMALLFRLARLFGMFSEAAVAATHRVTFGTPEFERVVAERDKLARRLSVDLSRYGIRMPARGPMAETLLAGRITTFDQGAIARIRRGDIRIIDGNQHPLHGFSAAGVHLGETEARFDDVILATGFEPRVEDFIADSELLGPGHNFARYPLTDGRCRSRIHPSIFFPGFDRSPLGGHSLGRWGWEVGETIAAALRGAPPRESTAA
jgi:indole-3-pyruvate monooxygenase